MRVIRINRTVRKAKPEGSSTKRRSILRFARDFFANENHLEFTIEALLFATLLALSAWPIISAAGAINQIL